MPTPLLAPRSLRTPPLTDAEESAGLPTVRSPVKALSAERVTTPSVVFLTPPAPPLRTIEIVPRNKL